MVSVSKTRATTEALFVVVFPLDDDEYGDNGGGVCGDNKLALTEDDEYIREADKQPMAGGHNL